MMTVPWEVQRIRTVRMNLEQLMQLPQKPRQFQLSSECPSPSVALMELLPRDSFKEKKRKKYVCNEKGTDNKSILVNIQINKGYSPYKNELLEF